jgi:hypothetical protein
MGHDRVIQSDAEQGTPRRQTLSWHRLWLLLAVAALACVGLLAAAPTQSAYADTFDVNSDGDEDDLLLDGTCNVNPTAPPVVCTLRAAIQEAENVAGADEITFHIPDVGPYGSNTRPDGVHVIKVGACGCDLPTIAEELTINGRTQGTGPLNSPKILIIPSDTGAPPALAGLQVIDEKTTITGLAIGGFALGMYIDGTANTPTAVILGNYVGVDPTGTTAIPNGIGIFTTTTDPVDIGGLTPADRNVISGNTNAGIVLSGADFTKIIGNLIGLKSDGLSALPNGIGISVITSFDTLIGGPTAAERNVISGNTLDGIEMIGVCGCFGSISLVAGNYIGLNEAGTAPVPNQANGITVFEGAGIIIGTPDPGFGNVISGNAVDGISLIGDFTEDLLIYGNKVGTDATGTLPRGNGRDGISLIPTDPFDPSSDGPDDTAIGSQIPGTGNVISANGRHGIYTLRAVDDLIIGHNLIGVNATGNGSLPNGGDGILTDQSDFVAIVENTIANNGLSGIVVTQYSGAFPDYIVTANSIYANGGNNPLALGLDVSLTLDPNGLGDGKTPNTPLGDLNFPILTAATTSTAGTVIGGTLNSTPTEGFRIELFANPSCDPSGNGEGRAYLGTADAVTDGAGNAVFAVTTGQVPPGQFITANSTSFSFDQTSEFSACLQVASADVIVTPTSGLVTTEGGGTATFTVKLSTLPVADVTINLSSTRPGEATVSPASLTFTSLNGTTAQTVTVTGVADAVADGNQVFSIVTAPATSLDTAYAGLNPPDVAGLNQDAPTLPTLSIQTPAAVTEGTNANVVMSFPVTLSPASLQSVAVNWQVVDGTAKALSDIVPGDWAGTLTFAPGETSKAIVLHVIGDRVPEGTETFTVKLSAATGAAIGVDTATGTILDDEAPPTACNPRPNVVLKLTRTGTDQIIVTVTAGSGTIQRISFGTAAKPITNATVETINPSGIIQTFGTFTAPAGVTQQAFIVRRLAPNQAVMVPLVIRDGCGDWTTFVGAGLSGF